MGQIILTNTEQSWSSSIGGMAHLYARGTSNPDISIIPPSHSSEDPYFVGIRELYGLEPPHIAETLVGDMKVV